MQTVIETENLSRRFGDFCAVDSVALRVESGAVHAFLGANGAGKTTTIRMLLGLIRPDSGCVRLFDEPFHRALLARAGSLVEAPSLYPHLTGRENLEVFRRLTPYTRADIDRALETVKLTDAARRRVSGYSLGMRQRLGLAIALLGNPQLLILDEPANGLDPAGIREMRELITRMPAERGMTVFVSSHLLAEVEQLATHVSIIDRGRLLFQGALSALRARMLPDLEIQTDRPREAAALLAGAGFDVGRRNGLIVRAADTAGAARANALLVRHGFAVHRLCLREPSLEHIFLAVTGSEKETETCATS